MRRTFVGNFQIFACSGDFVDMDDRSAQSFQFSCSQASFTFIHANCCQEHHTCYLSYTTCSSRTCQHLAFCLGSLNSKNASVIWDAWLVQLCRTFGAVGRSSLWTLHFSPSTLVFDHSFAVSQPARVVYLTSPSCDLACRSLCHVTTLACRVSMSIHTVKTAT
jgi:hypothetical protein